MDAEAEVEAEAFAAPNVVGGTVAELELERQALVELVERATVAEATAELEVELAEERETGLELERQALAEDRAAWLGDNLEDAYQSLAVAEEEGDLEGIADAEADIEGLLAEAEEVSLFYVPLHFMRILLTIDSLP